MHIVNTFSIVFTNKNRDEHIQSIGDKSINY